MNITVNMPELAMGLIFICSRCASSHVCMIILRIFFIILSTDFNLNIPTYFGVSHTELKFIVGAQVSSIFSLSPSLDLPLSISLPFANPPSVHVVRPSQFKIRFKLQDWLWLSVVPSEFLPTRNLAFNGILPCC